MHAGVRRYVVASAALLSASVIAVAPVEPQRPDFPVASPAVRLAADSIANVPLNLLQAILSVPANEVKALHGLADSLVASGNWFVLTPTNVFGWDTANPEMLKQLVNVLLPFPAISVPLGDALNVIAEAELPMNANCTLECPDVYPLLKGFFQVPLTQLISGYTFPTVINPVGGYEEEWSGETVHVDPLAPIRGLLNGLVAPPTGIATVTPADVLSVVPALVNAVITIWNPFVPDSFVLENIPFLGLDTVIPSFFRGLLKDLCPSCAAAAQTSSVSPAAVAGDVELNHDTVARQVVTEQPVASTGTEHDGQAEAITGSHVVRADATHDAQAGVAIESDAAQSAAEGTDTGAQTTALTPDESQTARTSSTSVEVPTAPSTTPNGVAKDDNATDGNKADPSQAAGERAIAHDRPAGVVGSPRDQDGSTVSKVTEPPKATEKTGSAGHDGSE
ncbi:MAG: hypothetical protein QOI28_4336 [Mycobacterium sp.]|nr:hypothetical protein [Mycobacterium sp.]